MNGRTVSASEMRTCIAPLARLKADMNVVSTTYSAAITALCVMKRMRRFAALRVGLVFILFSLVLIFGVADGRMVSNSRGIKE